MYRMHSGHGSFRAVLLSCAVAALAAGPASAEQPGISDGDAPAAPSMHRSATDAPALGLASRDAVLDRARETGLGGPLFVGVEGMRRVQQALNAAGFDAGTVDGVFGRRTSAALCGFQKAQGLEPTGGVTLSTMLRLGVTPAQARATEGAGEATAAVPLMIGRATVRQVQLAMAESELGWNGVDGMWTTTFSHALRRWQASEGLDPTGTITVETLALAGGEDGAMPVAGDESGATDGVELAEAGPETMSDAEPAGEEQPAVAAAGAAVDCGVAAAYDDPYMAQLYLEPSKVRRIERALGQAGYEPGKTDGVFDTKTSYGLVAFQKAQGIEPSGMLTVRTIGELGFGEVLQGPGS